MLGGVPKPLHVLFAVAAEQDGGSDYLQSPTRPNRAMQRKMEGWKDQASDNPGRRATFKIGGDLRRDIASGEEKGGLTGRNLQYGQVPSRSKPPDDVVQAFSSNPAVKIKLLLNRLNIPECSAEQADDKRAEPGYSWLPPNTFL